MDLSAATIWWVAAGVAVAAELATGTFYLLMLALGAVAGALAAHAGLGLNAQIACAALLGGGAMAAWHLRRGRRPAGQPAAENPDVLLDVGGRVHVARWHANGTARVNPSGPAPPGRSVSAKRRARSASRACPPVRTSAARSGCACACSTTPLSSPP